MERNVHRMIGAGNLDVFALIIQQLDLRTQSFDRGTAALGINDHEGRQPRDVIDLLGNGHALFDVLESNGTAILGHNRTGMRIPGGQNHSGLYDATIIG